MFDQVLQKHNMRYHERKYGHLLKDIPCNKDGGPCIRVCGYSKMTISVGRRTNRPYLNPVEDLQDQTDYVRSIQNLDFELTTVFDGSLAIRVGIPVPAQNYPEGSIS
ncbi:hypothetical protein H2248_001908 [Termitomyces sp. 'cryptogamus']|nr:hypothetical protein H2248_001908 [Termitomyces sp. 'cryptogamus']